MSIIGDIDGDGFSDITISGDANGNGTADSGDARFLDIANGVTAEVRGLTFDKGYAYGTLDPASVVNIGLNAQFSWYGNTISNSRVVTRDQAGGSSQSGADGAIIRNAGSGDFQYSVFAENRVYAGYGADGDPNDPEGFAGFPGAGGNAVAGILNTGDGQIEVQDLGFDGLARGGKGGNGASDFNDTGGDGGAAVVGILNYGVISNSRPHVAAIGVGSGSTVIGGGGGLRSGTGADGADGTLEYGLLNLAGPVNGDLAIGVSFTNDGEIVSDGSSPNANVLLGLGGNDLVYGGGGRDLVNGGAGSDDLFGGGGADTMRGGGGRDDIKGNGGDDVINGGRGDDTLSGGGGEDIFQFKRSDGDDVITGFAQGRDKIEILRGAEEFADLTITQVGADAVISFRNVTITAENRDAGAFDESDFIF